VKTLAGGVRQESWKDAARFTSDRGIHHADKRSVRLALLPLAMARASSGAAKGFDG